MTTSSRKRATRPAVARSTAKSLAAAANTRRTNPSPEAPGQTEAKTSPGRGATEETCRWWASRIGRGDDESTKTNTVRGRRDCRQGELWWLPGESSRLPTGSTIDADPRSKRELPSRPDKPDAV